MTKVAYNSLSGQIEVSQESPHTGTMMVVRLTEGESSEVRQQLLLAEVALLEHEAEKENVVHVGPAS
jgi:redox-sensitive bicupin YhaK (pirin superfamily)